MNALLLALALLAPADVYSIRLDPSVADGPRTGRLILFFAGPQLRGWQAVPPMDGPFFRAPQPIASIAVRDLAPGATVALGADAVSFPGPLATLAGPYRVQAVLDVDATVRGPAAGPGNPCSAPVEVTLDPARAETIELVLDRRVEPPPPPAVHPHLRWVRLPSPRLSAFYGRPVEHRAGVALPKGWLDPAQGDRTWPAIYVVPGFGGRDEGALTYAHLHEMRGSEHVAPQAVHVVLDPESPLGHHGFTDSPNHGPRETALVDELIPHLERTFRLDPRPGARIVTGHSSGGWSSLWLALRRPGTFGACWSSAPDPVDFSAFQACDLYADASLYVDDEGNERPSYRRPVDAERDAVLMTVRQEALMEHAIDPAGGSGQQWDAWEAMFSPRDPATGMPRPLFDVAGGNIDASVVAHWRRFDIHALVRGDWERYGPLLRDRVRLACGTRDSFYLERAVQRLAATAEARRTPGDGPGYILLVEGATHNTLTNHVFARWNAEMRAWLEAAGHPQDR